MNCQYNELEQIMLNLDHKIDMFWPQRLLKKHKNVKELKKNLTICLGYYHGKICDDIIHELEEQNILDKYLETLWTDYFSYFLLILMELFSIYIFDILSSVENVILS